MKQVIVQYETRPDAAAENERLIKNVFAELAATRPANLHYFVLRNSDTHFTHVAFYDEVDGAGPLKKVAAFQEFQSTVSKRVAVGPVSTSVELIGNYEMLPFPAR
jgi:hypothetical protein